MCSFDEICQLSIMSTNECQLNTPADWELWKEEFQSMTMTADLWEIVQDHKIQIQKSVESNINFYSHSTAALQMWSQSQAADSQATVAEDSQSTVQQSGQSHLSIIKSAAILIFLLITDIIISK